MKVSDLFRDHKGNYLSHTKLWNNIASAVVTWLVIYLALKADPKELGTVTEFALWYLAIVGGGAAISKGASFGFGRGKAEGEK